MAQDLRIAQEVRGQETFILKRFSELRHGIWHRLAPNQYPRSLFLMKVEHHVIEVQTDPPRVSVYPESTGGSNEPMYWEMAEGFSLRIG